MTPDNVGYNTMHEFKTRRTIIPLCVKVIVQLISFLLELSDSFD
jgi:hypothetical protein